MYKTIITNLGSLASIVALFFIDAEWSACRIVIVTACSIVFLYSIIEAIKINKSNKPIICTKESQINDYMYDWISTPGEVIVYSRDLSWVTEKIKGLMCSKAADLKVFAQHSTILTKELEKCGVKIFYYGSTGYSPVSRFTIIRANKSNCQIAIASPTKANGKMHHEIHESRNSIMDKYLLDVAKDLAELTVCAAKGMEHANETNRV